MLNQRAGKTTVTSVSVTHEFGDLIEQYNLSPTEVFRKGIAVSLCDLGVKQYKTPLNDIRLKYVNDFFKDEKMLKFFEKLSMFSNEVNSHSEVVGSDA